MDTITNFRRATEVEILAFWRVGSRVRFQNFGRRRSSSTLLLKDGRPAARYRGKIEFLRASYAEFDGRGYCYDLRLDNQD